ncbi:MAG: oligosaccharide flippase family protein [Rhodobacteraceae bacterium]|nr:oligosaccharide flippase family protein [Paracoccaceae bacterium]
MRENHTLKQLISNLMAHGASELATKISRLAVVVVVARMLEIEAVGLVAAAIAISDILKALTENGVVQRIIAANYKELPAITLTAHRIFWSWCLGLCAVQIILAIAFYAFTGSALIAGLIGLLALEYLFMPGGLVNCALAMRNGKLNGVAVVAGGQIVIANLLTAILVMVYPHPISVVIPSVLTGPIWLIGMRRLHFWVPPAGPRAPLKPFIRFGGFILGTEVIKSLRLQADKLVVGVLLGAEALGLYFFAFNAGLSVANAFSTAFSRVLYPYFCRASNRDNAVADGVSLGVILVTPIVILQAILAPFYVPILFGEKWSGISDNVSILCLAAIPALIWAAAAQWLRAENRADVETYVTAVLTVSILVSTAILTPYGLTAIVWGYLAVSTIVQITASWSVLRITYYSLTRKVK